MRKVRVVLAALGLGSAIGYVAHVAWIAHLEARRERVAVRQAALVMLDRCEQDDGPLVFSYRGNGHAVLWRYGERV